MWLPIETAPRDEDIPILLWLPDDEVHVTVGWYRVWRGKPQWLSIGHDDYVDPTHWMLIPLQPEASSA